ncbi:hypothetical protein [Dysgonomonas sp. 520]|uniref:hypothetical protein n=1 Tax=Dysgonomonas sp. 520 TaxID=2302931 RepID=UPI0013D4E41F|nr:hypothetical protein [Dysgonomonas sp. 520]
MEEYSNQLEQKVDKAVTIINVYDQSVKNALMTSNMSDIERLSADTHQATNQIVEQINSMQTPPKGEELKKAAIEYIVALQKFAKSQELYSQYNDTISAEQAEDLDSKVSNVYDEVQHKFDLYAKQQASLLK